MSDDKTNILLNAKQQEAVEYIDGPLLVLAGPGTGKTQLISARVANILQATDTSSGNILCLTYTEAGVSAMRERLAKVIGAEGYNVSVHTFHSFALEVMRRFPDYFLDTQGFTAVDELTSYQILEDILEKLPPSFKLAHRSFAREKRASELISKIAELKKAGLNPAQAKELYEQSKNELQSLGDLLGVIPADMPRTKIAQRQLIESLVEYLQSQKSPEIDDEVIPGLKKIILSELTEAVSESLESGKTTAITNFKKNHLEKDSTGNNRFKDSRYNQNLMEIAHIYRLYDEELYAQEKLEFDDMILNLIDTIQNNDDLKFNIQEQWQYILIDEFQDTSFSQLEIIKLLGDNTSNLGQPNIMIVGDDDQAIYAFQGASVSNIQSFLNLYQDVKIITLEDNYRSNQNILEASKQTAHQIEDRPAGTQLKQLKKSGDSKEQDISLVTLTDNHAELTWLCKDIKAQIKSGQTPENIAILAPRHRHLQELASELISYGVPVYYETSSNILEDEIIKELITLSRLVLKIGAGDLTHSNSLLAEVLSAPYWGLEIGSIWKLAIYASKNEEKKHWLEHLQDGALGEKGRIIYRQLITWSTKASLLTLEQMLDLLVGVNNPDKTNDKNKDRERDLTSPFKDFYFSSNRLEREPALYANFLSSLATLREHLRNYFNDLSKPRLKDLIYYIDLCEDYGGIRIARRGLHIKPSGVNLITAYGAKGLEFDQVYIIHCTEDVWSEAARGRVDTLKLTANFTSHKDNSDDKTRLFYVAQTRAKNRLVHTMHKFDEKGKQKVLIRYLEPLLANSDVDLDYRDLSEEQLSAEDSAAAYQQKLFNDPDESQTNTASTLAEILSPILDKYRLSATHLSTWLDEKYGGKEEFITRHLLRFPQALTESAVHGSAVHKALEKAHRSSSKGQRLEDNKLIKLLTSAYKQELSKCPLDYRATSRMTEKAEYLFTNLAPDIKNLINVEAMPEVDIKTSFEEVRLSGKLDAIVIDRDKGTATVRDYKTGRPGQYIESRYKNQLYLYKLLLDQAPGRLPKDIKLAKAELVYLNPQEEGVVTKQLIYKDDEYEEFKKLIKKVWQDIMKLSQLN